MKAKASSSAALVVVGNAGGALTVAPELVDAARARAAQADAPATRRAYAADWAGFAAWCEARGLAALPAAPEVVALYLEARAQEGRKASTIARGLVAIGRAHKAAGHASPCSAEVVARVMSGIRRSLGTAPAKKAPVLVPNLRAMVAALPDSLLGKRDRALLLLGWSGAFRRSELVGLEVADLDFCAEGLKVTLRRSKTDQLGRGRLVGIIPGSAPETCPVRALRAWLEAAGITSGRVFRGVDRWAKVAAEGLTPHAVGLVVKRAATSAGLEAPRFGGHSLRAGLVTAAAKMGKPLPAIMKITGHVSVQTVQGYVRDAALFEDHAAAGLGL